MSKLFTLYHGTTRDVADILCTQGWTPQSNAFKGSQCGNPRLLYLTNNAENALWYAEQKGDESVVSIEVAQKFLIVDPEDGIHDTVADELAGSGPCSVALFQSLPASAFKLYEPRVVCDSRKKQSRNSW